MIQEKEQISSRQLMFSIVCYIQGSSLVLGMVTDVLKQDSWIAILTGYLMALIVLGIYSALAKAFPGMSLVQINDKVFGKVLGKVFSILYIYFFFSLAFLNTRDFDEFMVTYIMPYTPAAVIGAMLLFVCAWAVRKGVETMTRYSTLIVILTFIVTISVCFMLLKDMKFSNFLPAFSLPGIKYVQGTHTVTIVSISEIMAFFMLFPYVKDTHKIFSSLYGGISIGCVTLFLVIVRNTAVIGPLYGVLTSPTYEAIRYINIGNILTRLEVLYAGLLVILSFFRISILFFAVVTGISQLLNLRSYKSIVPVVGVLILLFSLTAFNTSLGNPDWGTSVAMIYSSFFEVVLPLITLVVLAIRLGMKKI